jgi:hypothetical protein
MAKLYNSGFNSNERRIPGIPEKKIHFPKILGNDRVWRVCLIYVEIGEVRTGHLRKMYGKVGARQLFPDQPKKLSLCKNIRKSGGSYLILYKIYYCKYINFILNFFKILKNVKKCKVFILRNTLFNNK